jgi:hypothetical protein
MFKGQMPGIYDRDIEPELFYSSYVSTYIQRDIKELTQVADEMLFLRFLTAAAARTSQMLYTKYYYMRKSGLKMHLKAPFQTNISHNISAS